MFSDFYQYFSQVPVLVFVNNYNYHHHQEEEEEEEEEEGDKRKKEINLTCSHYGRKGSWTQGFGKQTCGKETTWKTSAQMRECY
jgi:hypothetical protein